MNARRELVLTSDQVLQVLQRLEPRAPLSYRQLRDLEARGCVRPRVLPGAKGPRVYGYADVLLLRLIARMQADQMLARWQGWSVAAALRERLARDLVAGRSRVLIVQGAIGRIATAHEAEQAHGVPFDLVDVARGVREAMRAASGDVWTGSAWMPARQAATMAKSIDELEACV